MKICCLSWYEQVGDTESPTHTQEQVRDTESLTRIQEQVGDTESPSFTFTVKKVEHIEALGSISNSHRKSNGMIDRQLARGKSALSAEKAVL